MRHDGRYVPTKLLKHIGNSLVAKDSLGRRKYEVRYLKEHHVSARAQEHFRDLKTVTVMQLYAAIRILLINASSDWERILLLCSFLDMLEDCFAECFGDVTLHPFAEGLEKTVRRKMQLAAGYDFEGAITDVGKWRRR